VCWHSPGEQGNAVVTAVVTAVVCWLVPLCRADHSKRGLTEGSGRAWCVHARQHCDGCAAHWACCLPACLSACANFEIPAPAPAGLSIMCGAIGYLGSLAFVRRIFRNVKVD
jgi:hypothetical protein